MKIFILFLFLSGSINALGADPKLKSEIKYKTRDLEKVQTELKKKEAETRQILEESKELSTEIIKSKDKIKDIQMTIENTGQQTKEVQNQIAKTKNVKDNLEKKYYENSNNLGVLGGHYFVVSTVMGPSATVPVYLKQMLKVKNKQNKELKNQKDQLDYDFEELVSTQKSLQDEFIRQKDVLIKAKASYDENQNLLQKKESRRQIIEEELKDLRKTASELTAMIDILRTQEEKETDQAAKDRLAKQISGQSPILARSLSWPVRGTVVEKFGRHNHPEFGTPYTSNGVRIKLQEISNVTAVANGRVLYAGNFLSFGPMVLLEHPGDWYSVYGHLGTLAVAKGQEVKEGESVGSSGINVNGNHEMYFELRFYGKPVDPAPWLKN